MPQPQPAAVLRFLRSLATPAGPPEPLLGRSSRPAVRLLPYAVAWLFVVILLPTTAMVLPHNYGMDSDLAFVLAVLQTAPLLIAVRRPLLAWAIAFLADLAGTIALMTVAPADQQPWPWPPMEIIGMLVLTFALGLREKGRTLVAAWLLLAAATLVLHDIAPQRGNAWAVLVPLAGVLLLLAAALRARGDARRALAEQETISEEERARRTLLEERARIARELHDVVAHHMSVITVQADSAPYRIAGLPAEASAEFGAIAATARESLTEMRRLLGVLRNEETAHAERVPQPGAERVPQLVEATVRAGLPVELAIGDGVTDLPQAVDLSAYRIVQEALANVVRHAPGAATRVSLTVDPGRTGLTVLVVNAAADRPDAPLETSGTGHGLVGMRERVRLVGGSLDTGPLPEGGFRVAARLPLTDSDTDTAKEPRPA
ncbi:sensor histidine kinase [Streptomyces sp. NPDC001262]|uniref:sensor histidine kinase n=1 Tax=Streptomyces sp. NPDC001262 TaxID=3364552 RepID=UPI00368E214D